MKKLITSGIKEKVPKIVRVEMWNIINNILIKKRSTSIKSLNCVFILNKVVLNEVAYLEIKYSTNILETKGKKIIQMDNPIDMKVLVIEQLDCNLLMTEDY